MTLYSKLGSYPCSVKDSTEGWTEVPAPPVAGPGQETIWWFPPGWIVRPVEPAPVAGHVWNWSQSDQQWMSYPTPSSEVQTPETVLSAPMPAGNMTI